MKSANTRGTHAADAPVATNGNSLDQSAHPTDDNTSKDFKLPSPSASASTSADIPPTDLARICNRPVANPGMHGQHAHASDADLKRSGQSTDNDLEQNADQKAQKRSSGANVTIETLQKLSAIYQQAYKKPVQQQKRPLSADVSSSGTRYACTTGMLNPAGGVEEGPVANEVHVQCGDEWHERRMRAALPWLLAPRLIADMMLSKLQR